MHLHTHIHTNRYFVGHDDESSSWFDQQNSLRDKLKCKWMSTPDTCTHNIVLSFSVTLNATRLFVPFELKAQTHICRLSGLAAKNRTPDHAIENQVATSH